jgi:aminoglycoside phosphotransferase (APT) family kinase protein
MTTNIPNGLIDQPKEIRKGEAPDIIRLQAFLKENLATGKRSIEIKQFPRGFSNLTYLITIGEQEFILRRPPFGKKARTAHDMSREYRVLKALHPVFPCPKPLVFCDDPGIMGCDFYIMERIRGIILRRSLPDKLNMTPADVRILCENSIKLLCDLHAIDYEAIGLGDFGKAKGYVKRQVEGWSQRYRNARTDDAPDCETVIAWLENNMPRNKSDSSEACIIHNDFKFDNLVLNPDNPLEIIGVLDWEMATLGDPLMDLGSSLGYWVQSNDSEEQLMLKTLPTDAAGMMSRREIVDYYSSRRGLRVEDFNFYYIFGLFRLAVIAQQIYYRFYHGQTKDERFGLLIVAVQVLERAALSAMENSQF